MIGRIFAGIVAGFIVATSGTFVFGMVGLTGDPNEAGEASAIAFAVLWVLSIVWSIFSERAGKAWRKLLLSSALLSFLMPISTMIFSGVQVSEAAEQSGAAAAGAVLGGGLVTFASGFLGFFLGVIFLVIGLLVGRDKQVVYVNQKEVEISTS